MVRGLEQAAATSARARPPRPPAIRLGLTRRPSVPLQNHWNSTLKRKHTVLAPMACLKGEAAARRAAELGLPPPVQKRSRTDSRQAISVTASMSHGRSLTAVAGGSSSGEAPHSPSTSRPSSNLSDAGFAGRKRARDGAGGGGKEAAAQQPAQSHRRRTSVMDDSSVACIAALAASQTAAKASMQTLGSASVSAANGSFTKPQRVTATPFFRHVQPARQASSNLLPSYQTLVLPAQPAAASGSTASAARDGIAGPPANVRMAAGSAAYQLHLLDACGAAMCVLPAPHAVLHATSAAPLPSSVVALQHPPPGAPQIVDPVVVDRAASGTAAGFSSGLLPQIVPAISATAGDQYDPLTMPWHESAVSSDAAASELEMDLISADTRTTTTMDTLHGSQVDLKALAPCDPSDFAFLLC